MGALFAAFNGKYVNLDLSACTGTSIKSIQYDNTIDPRQNRAMLLSILLPSTLTSIGSALRGCSSIVSIDIPASVTTITGAFGAFRDWSSLVSVELPAGLTSIGGSTFWGCSSLAAIDLPSGVNAIFDYAFYNCSSLVSVICRAATPPGLGGYVFPESLQTIQLPSASVNAYMTASNWSNYADTISAIN